MTQTEQGLLVDGLMPRWERRIVEAQAVHASPARTFAAIREVDFFRSPVVAVPNQLRVELDRWFRSPGRVGPPRRSTFRFAQLLEEDGGFRLLAEQDGRELVLGFIGRWWDRGYGRVDWAAEEFADFARPGCAVGSWSFTVLPYGAESSVLVTDVRVRCTDDEARRKFTRYWTLVGRFVTAMGRPILRLVRDEAEGRSGRTPARETTRS